MEEQGKSQSERRPATVRVCVHKTCCMRGSEQIYENLKRELGHDEAAVSTTGDCFRFCESGPNVAVNGNVLHRMRPGDAARRIRQEIRRPSRRIDGVGTRSLDDLDNVLKDLGI